MSHKPKIFAWDMERCSAISRHYGRWNISIRPEQTIRDERMVSFAGRWIGQPKSKTVYFSEWEHGRDQMLQEIHNRLDEADAVVTWNGRKADTKWVNREFWLAGMDEPSHYFDIDLMVAVKRKMGFTSNSLKNILRELGVEGKVEVGSLDQLTEDAMAGDAKAQRLHKRYNKQDVDVLADTLYPRLLPWIPASMHPNLAIGHLGDMCTKCGGTDLERRGFKATATGIYQQYKCKNPECRSWMRATKRTTTSELRA